MRIVIIEDEPLLADELEDMLLELDSSFQIAARLESITDSVSWLTSNSCDLIFLDVHLCDGLSFSIFDRISITTPIIFTTAFDSYAIKAFELNSIAYLLKPIEKDLLQKAIEKFHMLNHPDDSLQKLINHIKGSQNLASSYPKRFILTVGVTQKPVSADSIAYFMADNKHLFAYTRDGKKYLYDSTLAKLEMELDPSKFFRLNRRYYANIDSIIELIPYSKSRIKVKLKPETEEDVIISYARVNEFKQWLSK